VSPMSCQQPVTDVPSVGISSNYREVRVANAKCSRLQLLDPTQKATHLGDVVAVLPV
jgi:hypothetical protein